MLKNRFIKGCFLPEFVDRKVVALVPDYYLLAGDTTNLGFYFSLTEDKDE